MSPPLLELQDVHVTVPTRTGARRVVQRVTLHIAAGESVGLVGESGSGKSMTARAIIRLLPAGSAVGGRVSFAGRDVLAMDDAALRALRGREVAMIFQDPRAHINPVRRIGDFLAEGMLAAGSDRATARARSIELLDAVRVTRPLDRLAQYPHQLSGGLLQRVMIAAALAASPRLLLADEPTTALDVTTQAEVMAILADLRKEMGLSMLFITHDLDLAAATCDRTAVMYAGAIMEVQSSATLHVDAVHPYTRGLVAARPAAGSRLDRLPVIAGQPVAAFEAPPGCPFATRCTLTTSACGDNDLSLHAVGSATTSCTVTAAERTR